MTNKILLAKQEFTFLRKFTPSFLYEQQLKTNLGQTSTRLSYCSPSISWTFLRWISTTKNRREGCGLRGVFGPCNCNYKKTLKTLSDSLIWPAKKRLSACRKPRWKILHGYEWIKLNKTGTRRNDRNPKSKPGGNLRAPRSFQTKYSHHSKTTPVIDFLRPFLSDSDGRGQCQRRLVNEDCNSTSVMANFI